MTTAPAENSVVSPTQFYYENILKAGSIDSKDRPAVRKYTGLVESVFSGFVLE